MRILVAGPQGCGKTTQAQILAKKLKLLFVDAGDMLREKALGDNDEALDVREDLEKGRLVKDEIVASLVKEKLAHDDYKNGFIMDGYPRTLASAEIYDPNFDVVFYLDVDDEEVEKRLLIRGREDDTPRVIRERLKLYHQQTEPVLDHYRSQGKVVRVDGSLGIQAVASSIEEALKERGILE